MRFYFPDSQDSISPTYDFIRDEYSPHRVRQRDDRYAHEVLSPPPYDGLLVSKSIVDGSVRGPGKYSTPQRERIYRLGVRAFFRLPDNVRTLGDCGAFNYVNETVPPFTVEEVLDFYEGCGFDSGISVDHVILGHARDATEDEVDPSWAARRRISIELADKFLVAARARKSRVEPIGAAQGWSPASHADSVAQLQEMGYRRIALGGMVSLKTNDILATLAAVAKVRKPRTELHLLGVTRIDSLPAFSEFGVTSFDSTSPFRQAFMDARKNYHAPEADYVAIRVPQVDGNAALKRNILGGVVSQRDALAAERTCLKSLRAFDNGEDTIENVLDALETYEQLTASTRTYRDEYRRTLEAAPWKLCPCALCRTHGIEIAIFRGTERNKRRGIHNLSVFEAKIRSSTLSRTA